MRGDLELNKIIQILDARKKDGREDESGAAGNSAETTDTTIELGLTTRRRGVKNDAPDSTGLPTDHLL